MTRGLVAALIGALALAGLQSWRLAALRADVAEAKAATLETIAARQIAAAAIITSLRSELREATEAENEMPDGDACGLDAGRVRLLPRL